MDKKVLKRAIISSATFTILPSISILLGVIALSGTLGVPFSWLRLSVIGALQYELNVAEIAAQSAIGLTGLKLSEMSMSAFATISLVMTIGILGGVFCCIFFLKKYLAKSRRPLKRRATASPVSVTHATTCIVCWFVRRLYRFLRGDVLPVPETMSLLRLPRYLQRLWRYSNILPTKKAWRSWITSAWR